MEILLLDKLILCGILFAVSLGVAAYSTLAERKVAAWLQDRIGPNRAGPGGLFQPLADGLKSFFKEEITPNASDKLLFIAAPCIFMCTALMGYVIMPWGPDLLINGRNFSLQIADLNIGILYFFGVASLGVYGIMIGGWASNNKFALLGSIRASSQMISYELAMGLSIVPLIMMNGSLSVRDIVEGQAHGMWNVILQPVSFLIFLVCAFAECNRAPFDLPETESELNSGYLVEYSSMKMALFLFGEYVSMFISSALISSLFFGGYKFPGIDGMDLSQNTAAVLGILFLFAKTFFFIFFFMWVRWTLPRFRFDHLMSLGWKVFIPLAIVNILVTGFVLTYF